MVAFSGRNPGQTDVPGTRYYAERPVGFTGQSSSGCGDYSSGDSDLSDLVRIYDICVDSKTYTGLLWSIWDGDNIMRRLKNRQE